MAMLKSLTRTESALAVIFWMLVVQSAAGLLPALYVWTWPSAHTWGYIVVIAFDSMEKARGWYYSAAYEAVKPIRQSSTKSRILIVEGVVRE